MPSIDERIVDLQFKNAQFEQAINETLKSLEELKKSLKLDGAGKGFDELNKMSKDFNLDHINQGLETVKVGFSALQVIGITVLSELTRSAMNLAKSLITAVPSLITAGGKKRALNIEQAKFMFEGLGMDVEASMHSAREAVLGTAYGLDEAAKVASQLGASGMQAGEEMTTSLRGIAGVAAMTSSSYEEIGNIFTTVAGNGKLMTIQLRQLSNRGLNAAAVLAESMGKSEEAVRDMVTKGKISFNDFSKAMSDAFGEHATSANKTFLGAMSNLRSAFSRIGADYYTPFYENIRQVVNALTPVINSVHEGLKPMLAMMEQNMISARTAAVGFLEAIDFTGIGIFDSRTVRGIKQEFEALGINLDENTGTLKAMAGMSVVAKKDLSDMASVFKDVAEAGSVTGDHLEKLTSMGIDATGILSKSLKKTDEELQEMLTKGEISFEQFSKAMDTTFSKHANILSRVVTPAFESYLNIIKGIGSILKPIGQAFREIFPKKSDTGQLVSFMETIRDVTARFKLSEQAANDLKRVFAGVFAIFDIALMGLKAVFNAVSNILGYFTSKIPAFDTGGGILGFLAKIGDFFVNLRNKLKPAEATLEAASAAVIGMATALQKGAEGISIASVGIGAAFKTLGREVEEGIEPVTKSAGVLATIFAGIAKVVSFFKEVLSDLGRQLADSVGKMIRESDFQGLLSIVNGLLLGGVLIAIKKFMDSLTNTLGQVKILDKIRGILDGVRGSLEAYQQNLKATMLLKIAGALAILAAALFVISTIDPVKMAAALAGITVLFAELAGMMWVLTTFMGPIGALKLGGITVAMIAMSAAILILSVALKNLASLDWDALARGGIGIAGLAAVLVLAANNLSASAPKLLAGSIGLIAMATALLILTTAVKKLGELPFENLVKGLTGVAVLMGTLAGFTHLVNPVKLISTGVAMIAIGVALNLMARAIATLGGLVFEELIKGLTGVGAALLAVAGFISLIDPVDMISIGVAMIAIGVALNLMARAIINIGALEWEDLSKGLTGISVALLAVAAFTNNIKPVNMMKTAGAITILGVALNLIAAALKSFAANSWEEMARGLATLGGSLVIIAGAMKLMTGGIAGAVAMTIMAAAIMLLVPSLMLLGSMSLASIGLALLALAGGFTVIGIAALVLGPVIPLIFALSAGLAILGVALLAIGTGVFLFATGIAVLAAAAVTGTAAMVIFISSLLELIPLAAKKLGEGIVEFAKAIKAGAPALKDAFKVFLVSVVQVITETTPQIVNALVNMIVELLKALADAIPQMVEAGTRIILGIVKGIAEGIKDIVVAALKAIEGFLRGIAQGLPGVIDAAVTIVTTFIVEIGRQIPRIIEAGFHMVIELLNGIAKAIDDNAEIVGVAAYNLGKAIITGIIKGIAGFAKSLYTDVKNVASQAVAAFKGTIQSGSPSKVFMREGENIIDGLKIGLEDTTPKVLKAVRAMAEAIRETFRESAELELEVKRVQLEKTKNKAAKEALQAEIKAIEEELQKLIAKIDESFGEVERRLSSYIEMASERFNRLSRASSISVEEMVRNLRYNQRVMAEWSRNISILAERGLDEGLLKKLHEAGPRSAGEIRSLVKANQTELDRLNDIYGNAGSVATKALMDSLSKGTPLVVEEGERLIDKLGAAIAGTDSLNTAMSLVVEGLTMAVPPEFNDLGAQVGDSLIRGLDKGVSSGFTFVKRGVDTLAEEVTKSAYDAFQIQRGFSQIFKTVGREVASGFEEGLTETIYEKVYITEEEVKKLTDAAIRGAYESFKEGLTFYDLAIDSTEDFLKGLKVMSSAIWRGFEDSFLIDEDILARASANLDNALNAIEHRLSSYTEIATDRFNRINQESSTSVEEMITNLKHNQMAIAQWATDISELARKGLDDGLLLQLREAGPKSAGEVRALVTASQKELEELNEVYRRAGKVAGDALAKSLPESKGLIVDGAEELVNSMAKALAEAEGLDEAMALLIDTAFRRGIDPERFSKVAEDGIEMLVRGFSQTIPEVVSEVEDLNTQAIGAIESSASNYYDAGVGIAESVATGMDDKKPGVVSVAKDICEKSVSEIQSFLPKFTDIGKNLVDGMINGMRSKINDAANAAAAIARAAYSAAMSELGIQSPSRKFFEIGRFVVAGFANGLDKYSNVAEESASKMSRNVMKKFISSMTEIVNEDFDFYPTITPVIDMENVDKGIRDISNMFTRKNLYLATPFALADNISGAIFTKSKQAEINGEPKSIVDKNITFTQNNYSPKALSSIDIYRSTRNQISTLKGVLR